MSNAIFPALKGVKKGGRTRMPIFKTTIKTSVNNRELHRSRTPYPRYQYALPFEYLRASQQYQEWQALMGFFNARRGSFESFLYEDPDDNSVTAQQIGVGDGMTSQFQLARTLGGFTEPVLSVKGTPELYCNRLDWRGNEKQYPFARSNLLTYSEYLSNSVWQKVNGAQIVPGVVALDGSLSAFKLREGTSSSGGYYVGQAPAAAGATTHTFYALLKAGERTKGRLRIGSGAGATFIAQAGFDLSAGTVSLTGTGSVGIVPYSDGWYLVWVTGATLAGDSSIHCRVYVWDAAGNETYTGDGSSGLYVWIAQCEPGSIPTGYIPSALSFTSRGSTAWYWNSAGVLTAAANNVARMSYNPANLSASPKLLLEAAATNSIRNNTMQGAAAGAPGTVPTNWTITSSATGLSRELALGSEEGIDYIDIRYSGTATSGGSVQISTDNTLAIVASNGQTWTLSSFLKLAAGTLPGNVNFLLMERDSGGALITSPNNLVTLPTAAALRQQRMAATRTLSGGATVARLSGRIDVTISNGATVDFTLRVGLPQLEQGSFATSPIRTTGTAVTRSADVSTSAASTRTDYTLGAAGEVTLPEALVTGGLLSWTGQYYWRCRFLQDQMEFARFLKNFWQANKVEFITVQE